MTSTIGTLLVALLALTSAGCVGITTSHVRWPQATPADRTDFDGAMAYADRAMKRYQQALGNQTALSRNLGAALIPFAAAAGGLAVTGGSTAAITALLMTTGAGAAEIAWLTSKPEQRAWAAGYNAISCAQLAVAPARPFLVPRAGQPSLQEWVTQLDSAVTALEGALARAKGAVDSVRGDLTSGSLDAADRAVAEAEATRREALATLTSAETARQEAESIPGRLVATVDKIGGQVDVGLIDAGPDIQALMRLVSGLAQGYGQFVQLPARPTAPVPAGEIKAEGALVRPGAQQRQATFAAAMTDLEVTRLAADRKSHELAAVVNAMAMNKPVAQLLQCGVDSQQLGRPFTVSPPGPVRITAGTAATASFVIEGGAPPFAVNLEGAKLDGLTIVYRDPMSSAFLLQASSAVAATSAAIHVTDRSGRHQFVEVAVVPAARAETPPGGDDALAALQAAPNKLETTPRQTQKIGDLTFAIAKTRVDQTKKTLVVDLLVTNAQGNALDATAAQSAIDVAKDKVITWIANTASLPESAKSSIVPQAAKP